MGVVVSRFNCVPSHFIKPLLFCRSLIDTTRRARNFTKENKGVPGNCEHHDIVRRVIMSMAVH